MQQYAIDIYVKKQNNQFYSRKGTITPYECTNYTETTCYIEFKLKARFLPLQEQEENFKGKFRDYISMWYNAEQDIIYTITTL